MPSSVPALRIGRQSTHWTKPPENTLKLNCDASFFPDERTGSWGTLSGIAMVTWFFQAEVELTIFSAPSTPS